MDFSLSKEDELFRKTIAEFSERYVSPRWIEIDESGVIPTELISRMAEEGLLGIPISEEYGGLGETYLRTAIAIEELAYHDPAVAIAVYVLLNNGWPYLLQLYSGDEVKGEVLPNVVKGRYFFGIASTEPHGGSDVAGIRTFAERDGDVWRVSGEKIYISGVREVLEQLDGGGWLLVSKTGSLDYGHRNITTFAFLPRLDGQLLGDIEYSILEEIGRGGLSTGLFKLSSFPLDDKYRVGDVGKGFYILMEGFNIARILVAAACVGSARWALDKGVEWIRDRRLFNGRRLSSFQGIYMRFSELYAELEAARLFTYRAAWLVDKIYGERDPNYNPRDLNVPVALAKYKGPETAARIYEEVMKWMGAFSYMKESNVYRGWLGILSYLVGAEGGQNIMKIIIARDLIGREYIRG